MARPERHALRATSGTSPPSTWSARGTSSRARRRTSSSPCSTAAWRSERHHPLQLAIRVSPDARRAALPARSAWSTCRLPRRRSSARADRRASSSPRDFIWNDDLPVDLDGHGTHVAGTVGQLTNNGIGTAGMAYNVRLMPVKVIQGLWDEIFGSPVRRHRRRGRARHPLRRRQRREGDQPEHRPRRGRTRAGGDRCDPLCRRPRLLRRRSPRATRARTATSRIASRRPRRTSTAWSRSARSAARSISRSIRRPDRIVELSAPGGDQRQGGTSAGILQQTLDLDQLETY